MDPLEREQMIREVKQLEAYLENFYPETPEDEEQLKKIKDKIHVMKWALHGRY